jgi:hypothetical protein
MVRQRIKNIKDRKRKASVRNRRRENTKEETKSTIDKYDYKG